MKDYPGGYTQHTFVVDLYDEVLAHKQRTDVPFYVEQAGHCGGAVLELGCGTGRILIPIAQSGIQISGLDASPRMLSVCEKKLSLETNVVRSRVSSLDCGDMRDFRFDQTFDLVIVPFYSFNYLTTVDDQLACLSCVHKHLKKGGTLTFDIPNPNLCYLLDDRYLREFDDGPEFTTSDGLKIKRRHLITRRDMSNQVVRGETIYYLYYPDGRTERKVNSVTGRYVFRYEVEHLLARSGFDVRAVYSDFDKSMFGEKYPGEIIIVAVRKDE